MQVESRGRMHGRTRTFKEIRIPASGKREPFLITLRSFFKFLDYRITRLDFVSIGGTVIELLLLSSGITDIPESFGFGLILIFRGERI